MRQLNLEQIETINLQDSIVGVLWPALTIDVDDRETFTRGIVVDTLEGIVVAGNTHGLHLVYQELSGIVADGGVLYEFETQLALFTWVTDQYKSAIVDTMNIKLGAGAFRLPVHQALFVDVTSPERHVELQNINSYYNSMTITKEELNMINGQVFGHTIESGETDAVYRRLLSVLPLKNGLRAIATEIANTMRFNGSSIDEAQNYADEYIVSLVNTNGGNND